MKKAKPPFRADMVGSLLRPQRLKEARAKLEAGEISPADLRKIEDMEIEKIVHRQASTGLKLATDGEFRRSWWHFDFLSKLTGCEMFHPDEGIQFAGIQTRHEAVRVIGKLDFPDDHPMLDHFKFLKRQCEIAHVTPKMTIPSPAVLHFRGGRRSISKEVYPDLEPFFEDIAKTYRKAIRAFYDAGCRYLQLDDTYYDGYFLEYDSERAGGFEPLRYLPKGNKIVVVGVITSKSGELEKKDDIKRRLDEAAKFVALDQLALSPQCGFASTEEGNILTEDEQWAKLKLAVDVANEVWGK